MSPFIAKEPLFPPSMLDNFSYPQVKDNSSISPVQSISPMHINPPNLPPLPPIDWTSLIVGRAFSFDVENDTHHMHPCVYPQVEDTCTVKHRPNTDAAMQDAPVGSGAAEFEDATEIECALRNASIGICKDALSAFHSTDDDEGGGEDQVDAHMFDNLSLSGIGSVGALHESNSNPLEYSEQGNEEQRAEKEGDKVVDLLAHNVDPYEDAICNDANGGFHAFLPSKPQSFNTNILHNEVCIYFTYLFSLKSVLYLLVNTSYLPRLSVLVVFFIWIVLMTSIVCVRKMW